MRTIYRVVALDKDGVETQVAQTGRLTSAKLAYRHVFMQGFYVPGAAIFREDYPPKKLSKLEKLSLALVEGGPDEPLSSGWILLCGSALDKYQKVPIYSPRYLYVLPTANMVQ